jgi:hypothetical protein
LILYIWRPAASSIVHFCKWLRGEENVLKLRNCERIDGIKNSGDLFAENAGGRQGGGGGIWRRRLLRRRQKCTFRKWRLSAVLSLLFLPCSSTLATLRMIGSNRYHLCSCLTAWAADTTIGCNKTTYTSLHRRRRRRQKQYSTTDVLYNRYKHARFFSVLLIDCTNNFINFIHE